MKFKNWLHAVGLLKCPRCLKGDMFITGTFSFKKSFDMHDNCPHCSQKYTLESGFYYGAMFISYIITAFTMFGVFGIFKFLFKVPVMISFIIAMSFIFAFFVWFFRVSRAIWLSFFVDFDEKYV
jgi:uncharacterized protein (DUF983 family)